MLVRLSILMSLCFLSAPASLHPAEENLPAQEKEQQKQPTNAGTVAAGEVSGRVLRADTGRPLPKAVVTLSAEARLSESTAVRTDASGVFRFPGVAPGRYRLRAQRNGYVPHTYGQRGTGPGRGVAVEAGQHVEKTDFQLEPAGVISGTVTDEDSELAEGVEVRALRVRFSAGGRQEAISVRSTRTDDLGSFRLSGLAPGSYFVQVGGRGEGVSISSQVAAYGYAPTYYPRVSSREDAQRVQVASGGETRGIDISVRTIPTFSISGVIVDASPGFSRRHYAVGFARGGGMATSGLDRQDGSFTLRGLEPGEYTIVGTVSEETGAARRGYRNVRIVDADVRVTIEIGRVAEVRGELRAHERAADKSGLSLSGLHVFLKAESENGVNVSAAVEKTGKFAAKNIPEGSYFFQLSGREQELYLKEVRCAGEDYTARALSLASDQVLEDCTLLLARDVAEVSGRVTKDDAPQDGLVVVLIPVEPARRRIPRHTATAQTDTAGEFQFRGVVPGEYFVFAVPPSDDGTYYDLDFADRSRELAERLTVKPSERHVINPKPARPQ